MFAWRCTSIAANAMLGCFSRAIVISGVAVSRASPLRETVVRRGRTIRVQGNRAWPTGGLLRSYALCVVVYASHESRLPILKPPPSMLTVTIASLVVVAVAFRVVPPPYSCRTRIKFRIHHVEPTGFMSTRPLNVGRDGCADLQPGFGSIG